MEHALFAFNVVFPLFALIFLGMLLRRAGILDDHYVLVANRLVYKLALPMLVFNNIYANRGNPATAVPLLTFMLIGLSTLFLLSAFVMKRLVASERRGILMQNTIHSNSILFGLPLITNMFGNDGAALLSTIMPITTPYFNTVGVLAHAIASTDTKAASRTILKSLAQNMIIHGALWGIVFNICQLYLPIPLETVVTDLARLATPTALLALGASFKVESLLQNLKLIALGTGLRLIVTPVIMTSLAVIFGFRGIELSVMMVLFAGPIAVSSLVQTQEAGGDVQFAAQLIVVTTLLSGLTLFSFIFILRSLSFI